MSFELGNFSYSSTFSSKISSHYHLKEIIHLKKSLHSDPNIKISQKKNKRNEKKN